MVEPEHYLPGQSESEEVQLFIRKHWISQLNLIIIGVVAAIIPLIVLSLLPSADIDLSISPGRNIVVTLVPTYYLALITYLYIRFLEYYLDVVVITNERIVDIDQLGLFNRQISELTVGMVQDAKATRRGIFQTFFDYGDVLVETASESQNFQFDQIPHPNNVAQTVINLSEAWARSQSGAADIKEAVDKLAQVASQGKEGSPTPKATGSEAAAPSAVPTENSTPQTQPTTGSAAKAYPVTANPTDPQPAKELETPPDEVIDPQPKEPVSVDPATPLPPSSSPSTTAPSKPQAGKPADPFVRPEDEEWQDLPREPE